MKGKKIFIILIIINILLIGVIYNFIRKDYLNNEKIIVKAMTRTEYENNITSLNAAHEDYVKYIEESKKKIASAITEMGVETSNEENLETMANNIKSITFSGKMNFTEERTYSPSSYQNNSGSRFHQYYVDTFEMPKGLDINNMCVVLVRVNAHKSTSYYTELERIDVPSIKSYDPNTGEIQLNIDTVYYDYNGQAKLWPTYKIAYIG